jgi:hypothetical protein
MKKIAAFVALFFVLALALTPASQAQFQTCVWPNTCANR